MKKKEVSYIMSDVYRYMGNDGIISFFKCVWCCHGFRVTYFMRKSKNGHFLLRWLYRRMFAYYRTRYGIQTHWNLEVGRGFYIGHFGTIIINANVKIGENCNINQGVTIGAENRGKRKGVPILGNKVWVGANSVIVGKVTIGDNVLIAPLSYVNFDVPSNSIVIGNPAKIINKKDATIDYITNCII